MKKIILICLLLILGINSLSAREYFKLSNYAASAFDTTLLPQILALPLQSYIGKPVDSLLSVLPGQYTSRGFMPVGIGYTKGIFQSYFSTEQNNCFVEIYIDTFTFLPVPNRKPTTKWDINLAKKEKIAFIKVIKNNNSCVYGCNNPNYYD
jgi:hypothetical protein